MIKVEQQRKERAGHRQLLQIMDLVQGTAAHGQII